MSNHIEDSPMVSGEMAPDPTPKWKRVCRWLLQAYYRHFDHEEPKDVILIPERPRRQWEGDPKEKPTVAAVYAKDAIFTEVTVSLSFLDKMRLLLGCNLRVNSVTYCEKPPGAVKTSTNVFATFD